jgi:GNAT superfamily N-acetyltransferase
MSQWGILAAFEGERRVGGAVVAWKTNELVISGDPADSAVLWDLRVDTGFRHMGVWKTNELVISGDPADSAVLWDLRVDTGFRHMGVGSRLFACVLDWGRARSCRRLEIETQNINVPACQFYARHGCDLIAIDRYAYRNVCNEVRLLWENVL